MIVVMDGKTSESHQQKITEKWRKIDEMSADFVSVTRA